MKNTVRHILPLLAAMLLCSTSAFGLSPETRAQIEGDWAQQETITRKLDVTDPEALEGAIARGRLLIADMKPMGAAEAACKAEETLDGVENAHAQGGEPHVLYNRVRWAIRAAPQICELRPGVG